MCLIPECVSYSVNELLPTGEYRERLKILFGAWVYGGAVTSSDYVLPAPANAARFDPADPHLVNFTDATGATFEIIPACTPTASYEKNCFDGIDDDCNGG